MGVEFFVPLGIMDEEKERSNIAFILSLTNLSFIDECLV